MRESKQLGGSRRVGGGAPMKRDRVRATAREKQLNNQTTKSNSVSSLQLQYKCIGTN